MLELQQGTFFEQDDAQQPDEAWEASKGLQGWQAPQLLPVLRQLHDSSIHKQPEVVLRLLEERLQGGLHALSAAREEVQGIVPAQSLYFTLFAYSKTEYILHAPTNYGIL